MKARIIGFGGSRRDTFNNCCILEVEDKNPPGLIGRKVFWKTATGRAIRGKILRTHGGSALLARFKKGLPGFALGDELEFKAPTLPRLKKVAKKAEKPKVAAKKPEVPEKKKVVPKKKAAPAKPAKKAPVKKKPAPKKAPAKAPAKKPEAKKKAPAKAPAKKAKKAEEKKSAPTKPSKKAPAKKAPVKKPAKKTAK